jgi:aconitate hydratase
VLVADKVDILDIAELAPGQRVKVVLHHVDGRTDEIETTHTMSEEHIAWFKAGSALNLLAAQQT